MTDYQVGGGGRTTRLDLANGDTLTVDGDFVVSANKQTVRIVGGTTSLEIVNNGRIINLHPDGDGRSIRFEPGNATAVTAEITNNQGAIIAAGDDALQLAGSTVVAGGVTVVNNGEITGARGSGVDLAGGTGAFAAVVLNESLGRLSSLETDAVKLAGANASVTNFGIINGGANDGYGAYERTPDDPGAADGVAFEAGAVGTVTNRQTGRISGDRHGIDAGVGSTLTVENGREGETPTIIGRNGSGVGSDGNATIVNYGTITGAYSNIVGSDTSGPNGTPDGINDGDGDGIDVDGRVTLTNAGTIEGTGAGGRGSDRQPNTSEGIAAGGGSMTNTATGIISGLNLGILIDNSSGGNAPFQTLIENDGTIYASTGLAIRIISTTGDTIVNRGSISGGAGQAIQFGAGEDTLQVGAGSTIVGTSNGGDGDDTLDYSTFGGATEVRLALGTASGTGGVSSFETVIGSPFADVIAGGGGAETLLGGAGADTLIGGQGDDVMRGGAGDDIYFVQNGGDQVDESGGSGVDAVKAFVDHVMADGVEKMTLAGVARIGTGNALNNGINGSAANETIDGMGGDDTLTGGLGRDVLTGGAGRDLFVFNAAADSVIATSRSDVITDFSLADGDLIFLRAIDANQGTAGNAAFAFIGAAGFTAGQAGTLRAFYNREVGVTVVQGETNGDGVADFQILLNGRVALDANDFVL